MKELGKVVERFAPPTIERKDRERIVTVSAVISGEALGNVVNAGNAIIDKMDIPSDVTIQVAGSYEDQQDSFRDLGTLAILIVVLGVLICDGSAVRIIDLSIHHHVLTAVCLQWSVDGAFLYKEHAECNEPLGSHHVDRYRCKEWYCTYRLHHSLP